MGADTPVMHSEFDKEVERHDRNRRREVFALAACLIVAWLTVGVCLVLILDIRHEIDNSRKERTRQIANTAHLVQVNARKIDEILKILNEQAP